MELPQYTLRPNTNRMVVPWVFKLLVLAILFYGGIYFNVRYALNSSIPSFINLFIFAFLIVLVLTQVVLYRVKFGKFKYSFYTNRVEFEGKKVETFMFADFQDGELKQNIFDKIFDTGSIKLSKAYSIGPISNVTQVKNYLEQLVKYYFSMQERYKLQSQQAAMQREMAAKASQQYSQQQYSQPVQQTNTTTTAAQPQQGAANAYSQNVQQNPQQNNQQQPSGSLPNQSGAPR